MLAAYFFLQSKNIFSTEMAIEPCLLWYGDYIADFILEFFNMAFINTITNHLIERGFLY